MMIEVEEVWRLIDESAAALPVRRVPLAEAGGAVLAEAAVADADFPPFDRSTVDGYAIRRDDAAESFQVVATVTAGDSRRLPLEPGQAIRIFTGAELPHRGLQVIMQEDAVRDEDDVQFVRRGPARNFVERGEDVRAGAEVIPAGTRLSPAALALLASIGQSRPAIIRPLRVVHFTSGNEIVPVEETPGPGRIRNSNATLIRALLAGFPMESLWHAHLPDDEAAANALIDAADPAAADVVLFSGGASVGDFDFAPAWLRRLGFEIRCTRVNVRPGKPLIYATNGGRLAFGVPGNPLSHFVCFHVFLARALARLSGRAVAGFLEAELASAIPGSPNRRVTFWPARTTFANGRLRVFPVPWNSSGHLAALLGVDALIHLPAQTGLPNPGAGVQILPLETSS